MRRAEPRRKVEDVLLAAVLIVVCLVLLGLGFVAPRYSRRPQGKLDHVLDKAHAASQRKGGLLGKLGKKSSHTSKKAADTSTEAGRKARRKVD